MLQTSLFYLPTIGSREEIVAAGGTLIEKGELEGGIPTAFIEDPDGYRIQI